MRKETKNHLETSARSLRYICLRHALLPLADTFIQAGKCNRYFISFLLLEWTPDDAVILI